MEQDPSLDKVKAVQQTVKGMLQQTEECAKFIREYTSSQNTGMRLARSMFSNNDSMIKDFQEAFSRLKVNYLNGVDIATLVTVTAISAKLELMQQTLETLGTSLPDTCVPKYSRTFSSRASSSSKCASRCYHRICDCRSSSPPEAVWP